MWDRAELPWLETSPTNFREICRALEPGASGLGDAIRRLASTRMSPSQLSSLSRSIKRLEAGGADLKPLIPIRVALLGNGSQDLISDALIGTAARHGLHLQVIELPFNGIEQMAFDDSSDLYKGKPDAVVLNFTHRAFRTLPSSGFNDAAVADQLVDEAVGRISSLCSVLRSSSDAAVVMQTLAPPETMLFGGIDRVLAATQAAIVERINQGIIELARSPRVLMDVAGLAAAVGLDHWCDPAQWHSFKLPFSQRMVPLYCDHLTRTLAAMHGLSRKCLVLDLDNTVWGGVIGDDGIDGIRLGQGLPDGEAFLDVQRMAQSLRQRGIILAVSSKNTDAIARQPFRDHPDMILSEADITVFQANWTDKAENLRAIADTLNIDCSALVFLDDNPAERELVRRELPQVAIPELPADPALYPRFLSASGYFDVVSYSAEDGARVDMYKARAQAADLKIGATDLASYLRSLEMALTTSPFDAVGRSRIAQLINKSNQFNLTTRRYTEAQIESLEGNPDVLTLQCRLLDRFIDHGMICTIICRPADDRNGDWEIDTWLMSCRVLGRRVEEAVLSDVVRRVRAVRGSRLFGRYIPSDRNGMVAKHYPSLGFSEAGDNLWVLNVPEYVPPELPLKVMAHD